MIMMMMALMKLVLGLSWSFLVPRWNMCQGFPAAKRLAFHLLLPPSTPITTSITMLIKSSLLCCKVCHCKTLCKSATILIYAYIIFFTPVFDLHNDVCHFKPDRHRIQTCSTCSPLHSSWRKSATTPSFCHKIFVCNKTTFLQQDLHF